MGERERAVRQSIAFARRAAAGGVAVAALGDPDIAALSPAEAAPLKPIAVRFDHPTFAAIDARALAGETSFAEQVRRLVAAGLQHSGEFLRSDEGGKSGRSVAGDADVADRADPLDEGPVYIELRARGDRRTDEADFLAFAACMLRLAGFESAPADTHPPAHEIILPAGWRELPIVRRAFGDARSKNGRTDGGETHDNAISEGGAACGSPDGAGIAVTAVSAVSAPSGDLAGDEAHAGGAA